MAKRVRTVGVRGVLIDPVSRRVEELRFPAEIAEWMLMSHIGAEDTDRYPMVDPGEHLTVDALHDRHRSYWYYRDDDAPIAGPGLVTGFDEASGAHLDSALSLDEVRKFVRWWSPGEERPAGTW